MEVLPIMSTLENLIENPDEWEDPNDQERKTRKYLYIFNSGSQSVTLSVSQLQLNILFSLLSLMVLRTLIVDV